jgi:hypothetical protein
MSAVRQGVVCIAIIGAMSGFSASRAGAEEANRPPKVQWQWEKFHQLKLRHREWDWSKFHALRIKREEVSKPPSKQ